METIFLKIIACSGIVLGFYHLFLAKESTFKFNRYFLLIGLIFSYCIPFFTIELAQKESEKPPIIFQQEIQQQVISSSSIVEKSFNNENYFIGIYLIITTLLILKILYSLFKIKNIKGKSLHYQNTNVKIIDKKGSPFSFWNTIYLSERYFKNNKIDEAIFLHEKIHLNEKHSLDILLVEILTAFTWFNPFIYLFKKAINNNHEFMVDRVVIATTKNLRNYQELIFKEISKQQNYNLTHQLHFNNTKKRFIMMTKKNSKFALAKKYVSVTAFAVLAFAFAEKVYANPTLSENSIPNQNSNDIQLFEKEKSNNQTEKNKILSDTISPKQTIEAKLVKVDHKKDEKENKSVKTFGVDKPMDDKNIVNPEYPGGVNQFRTEISKNFDGSVFPASENGLHKAEINFTIEKDGSVTSISSIGNNEIFNKEATRVIYKITENVKWKPATKDGEPIAYRFRLPLTMSFETFKK